MQDLYVITMNLADYRTTRIILDIGDHQLLMTTGDCRVAAELIELVMEATVGPGEIVKLDSGGNCEFERTPFGAQVCGVHMRRADAIRLANELREAGKEAERHLGRRAA